MDFSLVRSCVGLHVYAFPICFSSTKRRERKKNLRNLFTFSECLQTMMDARKKKLGSMDLFICAYWISIWSTFYLTYKSHSTVRVRPLLRILGSNKPFSIDINQFDFMLDPNESICSHSQSFRASKSQSKWCIYCFCLLTSWNGSITLPRYASLSQCFPEEKTFFFFAFHSEKCRILIDINEKKPKIYYTLMILIASLRANFTFLWILSCPGNVCHPFGEDGKARKTNNNKQ